MATDADAEPRAMAIGDDPPRVVLGLAENGRVISDEDYTSATFEEPFRYELVDGRLLVMCPNSEEHDDSAEPWRDAMTLHKYARPGLVQKVVPEAWVRIRGRKFRIADLGVYLHGERSGVKRPARAPEWILEVVSPGGESSYRDHVQKRADYHSVAVLEYLVLDRDDRRLSVLTWTPDGYVERVLAEADTYATPLLPGLAVPLSQVFGV